MKGKQLRTFTVNEREMIFNVRYFQELFVKFASRKNIGIGNYEYEVADALFVDKSTIHNWRMNVNGPGDIEKIQSLAKFWNINYENLLMEVEEMTTTERNNKKQLTESEKIALRNVYSQFIISTHSPILMTFPNAEILEITEEGINSVDYKDTEHFLITKRFMDAPEKMIESLLNV